MGCGASRESNPSVHPAEDKPTKNKADKKEKVETTEKKVENKQEKVEVKESKDEKKEKKIKDGNDSSSDDSDNEKTTSAKPAVVFVLGGPGSGKGTQCERIVKQYGFTHFSVGDLLRAEKESGSKTAKLIDEYIAEGKLVPAKIPVRLIKKAMKKAGWEKSHYLVDGFPRNQENLEAWQKIFKEKVDVKFTLFYECSLETMEKRIMERSKTSGRSDDNPESIKKRFHTYESETKPVVEHFSTKGLIRKINAERDVEAVYVDTQKALDAIKDSLAAKPEAAPKEAAPKQEEVVHRQEARPDQEGSSSEAKPSAIFVLGGPGSGKGTQCERIITDFGFKHLSVGDLLRAEKTTGSEIAKQIEECMTQGKLVPSEVPVKLLKQAIDNAPKGTNFLIDGFPRNRENIEEWNKSVGKSVEIQKILYFECSFETMEKRILERGKTSGRSDDNPESLKKRFDTYQSETSPVIEEYTRLNMVANLNAETDVDNVYILTKATLKAIFP